MSEVAKLISGTTTEEFDEQLDAALCNGWSLVDWYPVVTPTGVWHYGLVKRRREWPPK